jgi:hypothetical protein
MELFALHRHMGADAADTTVYRSISNWEAG